MKEEFAVKLSLREKKGTKNELNGVIGLTVNKDFFQNSTNSRKKNVRFYQF